MKPRIALGNFTSKQSGKSSRPFKGGLPYKKGVFTPKPAEKIPPKVHATAKSIQDRVWRTAGPFKTPQWSNVTSIIGDLVATTSLEKLHHMPNRIKERIQSEKARNLLNLLVQQKIKKLRGK